MWAQLPDALLWLCGGLLCLSVLSGYAATLEGYRLYRSLESSHRRWWWAAIIVAALVRALTPFDLVRVFSGWELLARTLPGGDIPKYGAGFVATLRPLAWIHPSPEVWIPWLNLFLGVFTVAAWSLAASGWWRDNARHRVAVWTAFLLALIPLLVRHHRSESALPLAFASWSVGCFLWARWLRGADNLWAWLAVAPLALAAHTRPSFVLATPAALVVMRAWLPHRQPGRKFALGPTLAIVWLTVPQVLWLGLISQRHIAGEDLPTTLSPWFLVRLPVMLLGYNMALWPHAFPVAITAGALWVGWRGRRDAMVRGLSRAVAAVGLALLLAPMADPVIVSMPRLQAPWLVLLTCASALLWCRGAARSPVPAVAVCMVSMAATVPWLFRPENADHEAAGMTVAASHLRGKSGRLYWLAKGDPGGDKVSRAAPRWRFRPPFAHLSMLPLTQLPRPGEVTEPSWVWLGVRCYAREPVDADESLRDREHPVCAQVRRRTDISPVFERVVKNHGAVHFPWWPEREKLQVGLYRVASTADE